MAAKDNKSGGKCRIQRVRSSADSGKCRFDAGRPRIVPILLVAAVSLCILPETGLPAASPELLPGATAAASFPTQFAFVTVSEPTDFLRRSYCHYLNWVAGIKPATFWTTVRMAFTLIVCTTFCGVSFRHLRDQLSRGPLVAIQWLAAVLGLIVALEVPIPQAEIPPTPRALIFTVSIFGLLVLPSRLSFLLTPHAGTRKLLFAAMLAGISLLFVVHFLTT
jgi:hypothetical protein